MGWTKHTYECYAEINPTRKKNGTWILCALQFEKVGEIILYCLTCKGYKGFEPVDVCILYDTKILRGGEIMQNLLYSATTGKLHLLF